MGRRWVPKWLVELLMLLSCNRSFQFFLPPAWKSCSCMLTSYKQETTNRWVWILFQNWECVIRSNWIVSRFYFCTTMTSHPLCPSRQQLECLEITSELLCWRCFLKRLVIKLRNKKFSTIVTFPPPHVYVCFSSVHHHWTQAVISPEL